MHSGSKWLFRRQLSLVSLIKVFLDPVVSIATLAVVAAYFGETFGGPYLILSLVVFSLTFPGNWAEASIKALWNGIVVPWLTVAAIMFFFGIYCGEARVHDRG
jgi:putative colanic acid biosynthesis UDP-glucose lipid carrier transferase